MSSSNQNEGNRGSSRWPQVTCMYTHSIVLDGYVERNASAKSSSLTEGAATGEKCARDRLGTAVKNACDWRVSKLGFGFGFGRIEIYEAPVVERSRNSGLIDARISEANRSLLEAVQLVWQERRDATEGSHDGRSS